MAAAVQLRFKVLHSPSLPEDIRRQLTQLAGRRMDREGNLTFAAHRFHTRERNREDARERLAELIRARTNGDRPQGASAKPLTSALARSSANFRLLVASRPLELGANLDPIGFGRARTATVPDSDIIVHGPHL
ncbi:MULTISPECIES: hypothetical protein [Thiorhodovibrio]|uniref:hypothetical protein n=1 Tax=Thiorhodovibrio TaxID=61593 RepID=UPI001F5D8BBF|nr:MULTISPECIES: hypothetical protein [Thiorhodovibrio]